MDTADLSFSGWLLAVAVFVIGAGVAFVMLRCSRYVSPSCISLEERDEVPADRSRDSMRPTRKPRESASSAAPAR